MIFLLVAVTIYSLTHYYLYRNLIQVFRPGFLPSLILGILFILLGASFFLSRIFHDTWLPIQWIAYTWFGIVFITFTVLLLKDILRIFFPSYSLLLTRGALVISLILILVSLLQGLRPPVLREFTIQRIQPQSGQGAVRLVHLSDLHLQALTSTRWVTSLVDRVNELDPDLVLITGDLLDDRSSKLQEFIPILRQMVARHGVWAIPGNHDFYVGIDRFESFSEEAGIHTLRNSVIELPELGVRLAGLDDQTARQMGLPLPSLKDVLGDNPDHLETILLTHRPDQVDPAVRLNVDLVLSGHLHAGQIPPMDIIIFSAFKYPYGLYTIGSKHAFTTAGTGWWGPRMRLFLPSELVVLTLNP
ncbi:MAG TPA: metallophosphoesterase [Thermoanaerobaculia bacterium]|nr:metallophosphoesterase [Thermoanaerobaculia bacterium]HUM30387.1 metallophosphoesterase [Thermoanaerobaculia bacterium]HXK68602.1 metallophosphoesterase [Thermoanaerobaculia bacterium]